MIDLFDENDDIDDDNIDLIMMILMKIDPFQWLQFERQYAVSLDNNN